MMRPLTLFVVMFAVACQSAAPSPATPPPSGEPADAAPAPLEPEPAEAEDPLPDAGLAEVVDLGGCVVTAPGTEWRYELTWRGPQGEAAGLMTTRIEPPPPGAPPGSFVEVQSSRIGLDREQLRRTKRATDEGILWESEGRPILVIPRRPHIGQKWEFRRGGAHIRYGVESLTDTRWQGRELRGCIALRFTWARGAERRRGRLLVAPNIGLVSSQEVTTIGTEQRSLEIELVELTRPTGRADLSALIPAEGRWTWGEATPGAAEREWSRDAASKPVEAPRFPLTEALAADPGWLPGDTELGARWQVGEAELRLGALGPLSWRGITGAGAHISYELGALRGQAQVLEGVGIISERVWEEGEERLARLSAADVPAARVEIESCFPLTEGLRWRYELRRWNPVSLIFQGHSERVVAASRELDGEPWALVGLSLDGASVTTVPERWAEDGLRKRLGGEDILVYPRRLHLGQRWVVEAPDERAVLQLVARERHDFEGRRYDGLLLRVDSQGTTTERVLAPGIGVIHERNHQPLNGQMLTTDMRLIAFER